MVDETIDSLSDLSFLLILMESLFLNTPMSFPPNHLSDNFGTSKIPILGIPSIKRHINVPKRGLPDIKLCVPSNGSITQTYFASTLEFPNSSPTIPWSENSFLTSLINLFSIYNYI